MWRWKVCRAEPNAWLTCALRLFSLKIWKCGLQDDFTAATYRNMHAKFYCCCVPPCFLLFHSVQENLHCEHTTSTMYLNSTESRVTIVYMYCVSANWFISLWIEECCIWLNHILIPPRQHPAGTSSDTNQIPKCVWPTNAACRNFPPRWGLWGFSAVSDNFCHSWDRKTSLSQIFEKALGQRGVRTGSSCQ